MNKKNKPFSILTKYKIYGGNIDVMHCTCCHSHNIDEITADSLGFYLTYKNEFLPICDTCKKKFADVLNLNI